jgi:hypothetical protein
MAEQARISQNQDVQEQKAEIQNTETQEARFELDSAKKEIESTGFTGVAGGLNSVYSPDAEARNQQAQTYARMAERDILEGRPQDAETNSYLSKRSALDAQDKQFQAERTSKDKRDEGYLEKAEADRSSSEGLASANDAMKQAKDSLQRGETNLDKPMTGIQVSYNEAQQAAGRVSNVAKLMQGLERQGFHPKSLDSIKTVMQQTQAMLKPHLVLEARKTLTESKEAQMV